MKTKNLNLFLLLLLLGFGAAAQRSGNRNAQLNRTLDELIEQRFQPNEPGGVALVAKGDEVIYEKAFGMANLELEVPMQTDMVFRIGSVTKQFTAVAILQLLEQGKLSLQDDITKFIPNYPTHGHTITIHQLLNHTSGIMSYTDNPEVFNLESMRKQLNPEGLVDLFKNQPMNFAPGERFLYNNSGYILLGYIIEKVSEESYADYVRTQLFEPAGMEHSLYGDDKQILKNRAYGYQPIEDGYANADFLDMSLPYAAGSLMSTARDLFKWNQALKSGKILKPETLELAYQEG
ncbi:MAG: serine hydrolase domain-containing protein, partial [Bacteroides sp.]|nr:serine hydrolase domain-containing protein [Bacteroides sp.]